MAGGYPREAGDDDDDDDGVVAVATAHVRAPDSLTDINGGLQEALMLFVSGGNDALREELLSGGSDSGGLAAVQELVRLLKRHDGALSSDLHTAIIPVVKTLGRTANAYISSVASSENEEIAGFLQLDDNLAPLFEFLAVFTDLMQHQRAQAAAAPSNAYEPKALLRWAPFVLHTCAHVTCEQLPAAESMKAFAYAEQILTQCELITNSSSRSELLAKYIGQLVAFCSQSVSKEQWVDRHSFPKHVLRWIVLQVPSPHLGGDLLGRLLALVFPLIDDLSNESQLVGAQILRHIAQSVTATELRWYSDVLLEVLRVAITSRKLETIDVLLQCLSIALDKLSLPGEFMQYDKFFPRLLNDTSLISDVAMRTLFLRRLRPMIARMGVPHSIHLIRYLQPLLKVLVASFEGINIPLLLETLETLRVTILCAWPRVPAHTEEIFVGVMRAVAFCEVFDAGAMQSSMPEEKAQILQRCEHILELLHDLSSGGGGERTDASGQKTEAGKQEQRESLVASMLREVSASCSPLQPFCERMVAELESAETG